MSIVQTGMLDKVQLDGLALELAAKLYSGNDGEQPIIKEDEYTRPDRFYVTVVWDVWEELSFLTRSRVILNAYDRVYPEKTNMIDAATGHTSKEEDINDHLLSNFSCPHYPVHYREATPEEAKLLDRCGESNK